MPLPEEWDAKLAADHRRQLEDAFRVKHGDPAAWKFAKRSMSPKELEKAYQVACREALKEQVDLKMKSGSNYYNAIASPPSNS
jgi:hypothetical protein